MKTDYQKFIYYRTYSRWLDDKGRRETWKETVDRYWKFFNKKIPSDCQYEFIKATQMIEDLQIMPSMRTLWTAGEALERENIAGYNCAYTVIDSIKSFAEILYILMNGTGVGFSVERQYINKLPEVPSNINSSLDIILFADSKLGWAEGYLALLTKLYSGIIPALDYSLLRPKGSRLKTFGGRASGSEPLKQLCDFTINTFKTAQGRRLNSLECYDIVCMIANCVVVGGVRRSATINLSNFSDQRMRHAKDGQFWLDHPQRSLSNNSVAYTEKPDAVSFMEEWLNLARSGSGERGIINRQGFQRSAERNGRAVRDFGVNPCGEIVLRPKQFCNLTEVVVRDTDDLASLKRKVKYATILGCIQSTLSEFNFLDEEWKINTEEERLLGASLTGLADHRVLNGSYGKDMLDDTIAALKAVAQDTALTWAAVLGINVPVAICTVKPSGTVSQLCDSSSGLHPRYADYYIRRVRVTATDPIADYLMMRGVRWNPEVGEERDSCTTRVFDFYCKSPQGSVKVKDVTALEQLEYWLALKQGWCDHNPSATIYVKDSEWLEVGAWVYKHWDDIGGLSFLPKNDSVYQLAPYEEITEAAYNLLSAQFPKLNFEDLWKFEFEDQTMGARELACVGGVCELV